MLKDLTNFKWSSSCPIEHEEARGWSSSNCLQVIYPNPHL